LHSALAPKGLAAQSLKLWGANGMILTARATRNAPAIEPILVVAARPFTPILAMALPLQRLASADNICAKVIIERARVDLGGQR
jgi:hypothetical protein